MKHPNLPPPSESPRLASSQPDRIRPKHRTARVATSAAAVLLTAACASTGSQPTDGTPPHLTAFGTKVEKVVGDIANYKIKHVPGEGFVWQYQPTADFVGIKDETLKLMINSGSPSSKDKAARTLMIALVERDTRVIPKANIIAEGLMNNALDSYAAGHYSNAGTEATGALKFYATIGRINHGSSPVKACGSPCDEFAGTIWADGVAPENGAVGGWITLYGDKTAEPSPVVTPEAGL